MRSSTERVLQEPRLGRRQPGQELEAEVLGHEAVVAVKPAALAELDASRLQRQRREVQAGRPALRALGQLGELARRPAARPRRPAAISASCSSSRRSATPISSHQSPRPPASERERRLLPARDRDLRARREVADQRREHVQARRVGDGVEIVEHQHQRPLERGQRAPDARDPLRPARSPRPRQRVEDVGRHRLDTVDRGRDVAQEHQRVVVRAVERDPRERTRIGLGPPRQQRRLAVPGGRHHAHDRRARRAQPRDQVRLRHRVRAGSAAERA